MHYGLVRNSLILVAVFLSGLGAGLFAMPLWKAALISIYQDRFGEATFLCDHAMRDHLIAKQELALKPSKEAVADLEAAEVGLIACQDYDILRKKLALWGLTDNELSLMSLKAIEKNATTLQQVVEVHEIRY